jgi:hypothetical protein
MSRTKSHFQLSGRALALVAASLISLSASAQKKPKPALKDSEARRAVASAPLFALNTGAVKVRGVSAAGETPVVVTAEVELAVLLRRVGGETEGGEGEGWRADEFRTGDRSWERFDWFADVLDYRQLEGMRVALQSMALEFETRQRARERGEPGEDKDELIEVRRGAARMTELSPISNSARAVVFVETAFEVERGADKKWRVAAVRVGEEALNDLGAAVASVNRRKVESARADLDAVRSALERFRGERGFYVVADDYVVLIDHLAPRYLTRIVRFDPWHRPYRYEGTRERFTLRSDGPDGEQGTADDVTPEG